MIPLVVVAGTWGFHDFWQPQSAWGRRATERGFLLNHDPFRWSGDLVVRDHQPWQIAASSLTWYLAAKHLAAPAVLVHSHGIQIVTYAASYGQRFGHVLDIEGPPRSDMEEVYVAALPNMLSWTHLWNSGDSILIAGEVGEGAGEVTYLMKHATTNLEIPSKFGHSGLFGDLKAWD